MRQLAWSATGERPQEPEVGSTSSNIKYCPLSVGNITHSTGIQCYSPKAEWASWQTGLCKIDIRGGQRDTLTPKIKSLTVSIVSPSIYHEVMGPDAMILVF